jgi:hypothetical protein
LAPLCRLLRSADVVGIPSDDEKFRASLRS